MTARSARATQRQASSGQFWATRSASFASAESGVFLS
jgi:hypothetical protein